VVFIIGLTLEFRAVNDTLLAVYPIHIVSDKTMTPFWPFIRSILYPIRQVCIRFRAANESNTIKLVIVRI
jgi:hypothetical protein